MADTRDQCAQCAVVWLNYAKDYLNSTPHSKRSAVATQVAQVWATLALSADKHPPAKGERITYD